MPRIVLARAEDMLKDWTAVQHVHNRAAVVMQSVTVSNWNLEEAPTRPI
jgi:hypothetical protein